MAGTLFPGVNSLILKLDTPYDTIRTDDVRDDLIKVKVWCSAVAGPSGVGFTPSNANLVFDGLSLSITISGLPNGQATAIPFVSGTPYYVKYAFISDIEEEVYTVSNQLTATPISATAQVIDISGYTSFVQNASLVFTPLNATLTATTQNITGAEYAWVVTGGSPSSGTGTSITITPSNTAINVTVTLTVSGGNLVTNLTKTITMPILYNGAKGEAGVAGKMSAFPAIYQWTSGSSPPARPTAGTYTWGNPDFVVDGGWETTVPINSTPGATLWSITIPLSVSGTTLTSPLNWASTTYPVRAISYNGTLGTTGGPGAASYIIQRAANSDVAPTDEEVTAVIGRSPVRGDLATVSYNNYNGAKVYQLTSVSPKTWALMTTYIPGSLIVENTITSEKLVTGSVDAEKLFIGRPGTSNRIRLYNNKIEVWDNSGSSKPRVIIGDLTPTP
jgi:hypothetical protein